jgi:hypothetical protein
MLVAYVELYFRRVDNGMARRADVNKCAVATGCVAAVRAGHMYKSSFSCDVVAWVALWFFIPAGENVQV